MSHGDSVCKIPEEFKVYGQSDNAPYAVIADVKRRIYGVQFHPESFMTECGSAMIENFLQGSVYD